MADSSSPFVEQPMKVGTFAGQFRRLSLTEPFPGGQKLLEGISMLPIQLIDGPRRNRGLE